MNLGVGCYNAYTCDGDPITFYQRVGKITNSAGRIFLHNLWGNRPAIDLAPDAIVGPYRVADVFNCSDPGEPPTYAPCYELDTLNTWWWGHREAILKMIGDAKMCVTETFHDQSSIKDDWARRPGKFFYPFYSNTYLFGGRPKYPFTSIFPGEGPWSLGYIPRQALLARRFWETAWPLVGKANYYLEIGNEFGPLEGQTNEHFVKWVCEFADHCVELGFPRDHLKLSTGLNPAPYPGLLNAIGIFSIHNISTDFDISPSRYFNLPNSRIELSNDGWVKGDGIKDFKGNGEPSEEQMRAIIYNVKQRGFHGFEGFPRSIEAKEDTFKVANVDDAVLTGWLSGAVEAFGITTVSICTGSCLPRNLYCPITVLVDYITGREPTSLCQLHRAPGPEKTKWQKFVHWLCGPNSWWAKIFGSCEKKR